MTEHIEIYKKWRPTLWRSIIGQDKVVKSLQSSVVNNKVPTAYLFSGPRGTGKTTAALILAKAINCEQPDNGNPCNKCDTCVSITNNAQAGITYVSGAQKSGVDDMRDLVMQARLQVPIKRQVFILDEVQNLGQKAWEALLIPLEEKTMPALFILCTTEIEKVPKTILSRVQQRKLNLVDHDTMLKHVERIVKTDKLDVSSELIESAIKKGRGSVRDTLSSLEEVLSTGILSDSHGAKLLEALATLKVQETIKVIAEANFDGVDVKDLSEQLFEDLRDLMLYASGCDSSIVTLPPVADPKKIITSLGNIQGIIALMKEVGEAINQISKGSDARISLEIAALKGVSIVRKIRSQSK